MMRCSTCGIRRQPIECPLHVREELYERRVSIATTCMENEQLEGQANAVISDPSSRQSHDVQKAETEAAKARTADVIAMANKQRVEIEAARKEIESRKAAIAKRKADLDAAKAAANRNRS